MRIRPDPSAWSRPGRPATSISSRHQPSGRHSTGSTIRTACTRRSGMVSATVPSSPRRIRIPSGDCATVKPYSVAIRRHTRGASVIRDTTSVPPTAVTTFGDTRITTTSATSSAASKLAGEAATDPTSRPLGTLVRIRSPGSGVAGSSP